MYFVNNQLSPKARREFFNGREHVVFPAVMLVEGVVNEALALASEFGANPSSWNGVPVTVDHPKDGNEAISANQPEVLEKQAIGQVFNSYLEGNSLKSELWLDITKAEELNFSDLLNNLESGQLIEVSTGYYCAAEETEGSHNDNLYKEVHRGIIPDHLALLPNDKGACSVSDGCGVPRVNQEESLENREIRFEELNGLKEFVIAKLANNASNNEIRDALERALEDKYGNPWEFWIVDIFENEVVYSEDGSGSSKYLRQAYTFDEESFKAELSTEVEEVVRTTVYKPIDGGQVMANESVSEDTNEDKAGETKEAKEVKVNETVKNLASQLIANEQTKFEECDRVWLETQDETTLEKLTPVVHEEVKPEPLDTVEAVVAQLGEIASPEARDFIANSVAKAKQRRTDLLAGLVANKACPYTEQELQAFSTELLEKTQRAFEERDYSGLGVPNLETQEDNTPPPPPSIILSTQETN